MAEAILRAKIKSNKIKWWDVLSRGINVAPNSTINPNSLAVLEEINVTANNFTPKQLTQKVIENSQIIITMTTSQKILLEGCGNIVCAKDICGYDIADPYGGSVEVYRKTRQALEGLCDKIIENYILNK
jgi:protein-tyrosine phosphatase